MADVAVQQKDMEWGAHLSRRVEALQAERGDKVAITEIAEVVQSLMTTMEGGLSALDVQLQRELKDLVDYIQKAKVEIASIHPEDIKRQDIPAATDELDAVVKSTEAATQSILDAAEELGQVAGEVGEASAARILDIVTRIYEASNFQDVTGQRITKVVRTLRHIEAKVVALARAFGQDIGEATPMPGIDEREGDAKLLNGPQLPGGGNSQDDIDALLASFD